MKANVFFFDYFSEVIIISICSTLFVYTEYETKVGFCLNILSTIVDWYFSYLELRILNELKAFTDSAIKKQAKKIKEKIGQHLMQMYDQELQNAPLRFMRMNAIQPWWMGWHTDANHQMTPTGLIIKQI